MELIVLSHLRDSKDFRTLVSITKTKIDEFFFTFCEDMINLCNMNIYQNVYFDGEGCYYKEEKQGFWIRIYITSEENGFYNEGIEEGIWNSYYSDGDIWFRQTFVHGLRQGIWTEYYKNEQKKSEGYYVSDAKNGLWTSYWEDGEKESEGLYENGRQIGIWKFWRTNGEFSQKNFS